MIRINLITAEDVALWKKERARAAQRAAKKRQYELVRQEGRCAICGRDLKPGRGTHVDHCHRTGAVRGLLCSKCNPALGLFEDNVDALIRAAEYLRGEGITN